MASFVQCLNVNPIHIINYTFFTETVEDLIEIKQDWVSARIDYSKQLDGKEFNESVAF